MVHLARDHSTCIRDADAMCLLFPGVCDELVNRIQTVENFTEKGACGVASVPPHCYLTSAKFVQVANSWRATWTTLPTCSRLSVCPLDRVRV
jgi:hypothetical protein